MVSVVHRIGNIFATENIVALEALWIAIHASRKISPGIARISASSRMDKHPLLSTSKKLLRPP
jgi:hypothetical protein